MKKLLLTLSVLIFSAISAFAAPGDAVGEIYSTDILAFVNGSPISSYNIGGKTVVLVEELCNNDTGVHYGFECTYDNNSRTLVLASTFAAGNADITISRGAVGETVGTVYDTDIKVIFNSHEIAGYNIGGRTAICIEDLGAFSSDEPNATYGYSKYLCNAVWDGNAREIRLNTYLQDPDFFDIYPKRKLAFTVEDNMINCSFDQLNPFAGSFKTSYSDEFKNDVYRIRPVFLNDILVGQVVVKPGGVAAFNLNSRKMFNQTGSLETILGYGEAVSYIKDNFDVKDSKETAEASVYLAKKGDTHYLLFAMKNGGLVCESKYDSSYSVVELITNSFGELCLNLKSNEFSGSTPISTSGYEFTDSYEKYTSQAISNENRIASRHGQAQIKIDDADYYVDAIYANEYGRSVLVNINELAMLLDIDIVIHGGIFLLTPSEKHFVSCEGFIGDNATIPKQLKTMKSAQVYVDYKSNEFTADGKIARPYYYNGNVYVPADFFENLFN